MYIEQIKQINQDLSKTRRAVISLGCSFTQGQGAVNDELYEKYEWVYETEGKPLVPILTPKDKKNIMKQYKTVKPGYDGNLDFTFMEYENSFVNVLCKKYLQGKYTPINFGLRGCGNRATIKELYLNHEINLHHAGEIIVIFSPSGLERFDFVNDTFQDHFRWVCMWPHYESIEQGSDRRLLWEGYRKCLWSEKSEIIEQISHMQELVTWCKANKAKLIITPAFDKKYNKEYFEYVLSQSVKREPGSDYVLKKHFGKKHRDHKLVDLYPWDKFFYPDGHMTFADLALANDNGVKDKTDHYFQFLGKRSPEGWITPCAHPGQKAHDLFAKLLFEKIKEV